MSANKNPDWIKSVMKTLHTCLMLGILGMLVVISIQLRGLKPFTVADYQFMIDHGNENTWRDMTKRMPIVEVSSIRMESTVRVAGKPEVRISD